MRAPLAALVLVSGCLLDDPYKHRGPTVPEPLGDGWEIATPESVGLDPAVLEGILAEALREDRYFATVGLLVVKDGKLVFETYLRSPGDRDRLHAVQSVTKSVTSLVVGMGRDAGWLPALDTPVCVLVEDACAGLDPPKRAITLAHLLTMRSGLDFDNDRFSLEMIPDPPDDPLRYTLEKPLFAEPGAVYRYRDADPDIVAYLVRRLSGRTEEELAREGLFEPLGIHDLVWDAHPDGTSFGGFGLHLGPRDLARLGQLLLQDGVWEGRRLVAPEWLAAATAAQTPSDSDDGHGGLFDYGYYFWALPGIGAYAAWGHGGHFVLVVPARQLVLVQVGYSANSLHGGNLADFLDLVAPLLPPG